MAKLSALLMNRPPNAPDGGFVVQLFLASPVPHEGSVHLYPSRNDVDAPAIAHAFRDLAMWIDLHPDDIARWYDGRTYPECERIIEDTCSSCVHPMRRHDDTGCKDCGCPVGATDLDEPGMPRRNGVDETAVRRSRREKHPHMHGRECDVCRVIRGVAAESPWIERGLPGQPPRVVCRWCNVRKGSDDEHGADCAYRAATGLQAVYG